MTFEIRLDTPDEMTTKWILCIDDKIVVDKNNELPETDSPDNTPCKVLSPLVLGVSSAVQYMAAMIDPDEVPTSHSLIPLKPYLLELTDEEQQITLYGKHLSYWHHFYRHCVRCGHHLLLSKKERVKQCEDCNWPHYPVVSPAIIVLIKRGDEFLLARAPHFPEGMHSLIAGFVEPGESLEQCVQREIFEEVGVKVNNIQYQFSQPWPFPHSLMLGFTADYESGEISIDNEEIVSADWFSKDKLPDKLPTKSSIARKILNYAL